MSCPLLGVFAGSKKIPDGTFIGIYSGELLTDAEAHERGVYVTSTPPFPLINSNTILTANTTSLAGHICLTLISTTSRRVIPFGKAVSLLMPTMLVM